MMDWIVRILLWATGISFVCASLYWLLQHPLALIAGLLLAGWLLWDWWREKKRREREGWWIEFGSDQGQRSYVTYYEGENTLEIDMHKGKLAVPSPIYWDSRMPRWARGRRDEIISRIRQRYPRRVD